MAQIIQSVLELIGGTPLLALNQVIEPGSASVLVKLENRNPSGSVKDRIALAIVENAEKQGLISDGSQLVLATSGNSGAALAMVAAAKSYRLTIFMPSNAPLNLRRMVERYGAEVELTSPNLGMQGASEAAIAYVASSPNNLLLDIFNDVQITEAHYKYTAEEIIGATNGGVAAFVSGIGTGGTITGVGSFYNPNTLTRENERIAVADEGDDFFYTDAISDQAVEYIREHAEEQADEPFFTYVAHTSPHWPLHAHDEDIARYAGRFDRGWDALREERLERMVEMGLIDSSWKLTERDPTQPPWDEAEHREWQVRRMEVYAAQINRMDRGIGRIVQALEQTGQLDNTLILFLADNGGCAEEIGQAWSKNIVGSISRHQTRDGRPVQHGNDPNVMPGPEDTYQSYGVPWANVSNTPFREYKHWVHEGGISTPLIVHWPEGVEEQGVLRQQPAQLPDVMATFLEVAGAEYPTERDGHSVQPLEGFSMTPIFRDEPSGREVLYWEHEGNCAVRKEQWKLVCKYPGGWELYDIEQDRTELHDLVEQQPEVVAELSGLYEGWAARCNVMLWAELQEKRRKEREG